MSEEIVVRIVEFGDRTNYQMQWRDPVTGLKQTKSTGVERTGRAKDRREAERVAGLQEEKLRSGDYKPATRMTWAEFRERYENEKMASLATGTAEMRETVFNHLETIINPERLSSLTTETLSRFQSELRKRLKEARKAPKLPKNATAKAVVPAERKPIADATIAGYLGHLQAALQWAEQMGFIPKAPKIQKPRRSKGAKLMKGRSITAEELDRMLAAVDQVRKKEAAKWKRLMNGLWLSGLRLGEALELSWDQDAAIAIVIDGKYPKLRIWAEAEKGNTDRLLPLTPDFAEFLAVTPAADRHGLVFGIEGPRPGLPLSTKRASGYLSAIGEKAGVVVDKASQKFASAHDLRRAFGERWAKRVMPAVLQKLMRHRSIETTMKYYVNLQADDIAADLWAGAWARGNTLGNTPPNQASADASPKADNPANSRENRAEGMGVEPTTGYPAPHFQCGR